MAKNINKAVFGAAGAGGLYGKSKNIVRTEVHRVQESGLADSAKDIMQGLEGSGLVEVAIWRTMKDERVRPQVRVRNARGKWKTIKSKSGADHQKLEGKAIVVGDKFEVESGVFAECPGKSGTARNDCNCRCFLEYKLVDIEEAARLTGKSIAEVRKIAGFTEQTNTPAETTLTLQDNINKYRDEYVPVKTIEEAEEYAGRFIGDGYSPTFKNKAIYKGISVENANEINKTIYALYENIDMPKLNGIKVISPTSAQGKKVFKDGADAIAAYNPTEQGIFINKDLLKSQKAFESHIKKADEAWNTVMDNIDSLTGSQKELALIYKNAGRQLVDNSLQGAITHEVGHHIQWQVLDTKLNNSIGKDMSKYAPKISGYANASKSEYLAESFSAYIKGEIDKLDKDYVGFLDKKLLEKSVKSGIIKSLDIDDFKMFAKGNNIDEEVTDIITGVAKEFEDKGNVFISDVHFGSFFDPETKKPALMQVYNNHFGLTQLNINSDILGGKSLEVINDIIKNEKSNLPQNLQEAVIHEMGHAKTFYGRSAEQIQKLNEKYKNKGLEGISKVAKRDGLECVAEIEVLLYRGEKVSNEAMELYNSVMKEVFK